MRVILINIIIIQSKILIIPQDKDDSQYHHQYCIINLRCDGQPQCGDSTDEIDCSVLELDPSYNR